jgi:hypothetical protein
MFSKDQIIDLESEDYNKKDRIYLYTKLLIFLSLATLGFGDYFLGINVGTNLSTVFIYATFLLQIISKSIRLSKLLFGLYIFIVFQTFILNTNFSPSVVKHFIGFVLFSISIFSFISVYWNKIDDILVSYYKFVFYVILLSILQLILFLVAGISFIPQNLFSGHLITFSNELIPEIFGILPRSIGLSTEPAHFAMLTLPGVYIALFTFFNQKDNPFFLKNKSKAFIIIVGYILSFSLVAFLGLSLCLVSLFTTRHKISHFKKIVAIVFITSLSIVISFTPIGSKAMNFVKLNNDISGHQYTSEDFSAFALLSNIMVAKEALKDSHYLGTGLNTHKENYDKTIYKEFNVSQVLMELNKEDAGSLFIRVLSEFGIPGILGLLFFLFHFKNKSFLEPSNLQLINSMSLIVLITYCARTGSYLSVNFLLFAALYYYSYKKMRVEEDDLPVGL